jgi:hypothetical protein
MITTSNSPVTGSGIPNQLLGVRHHIIAISGLSRVRTEFFQLFVIPLIPAQPQCTICAARSGLFSSCAGESEIEDFGTGGHPKA